MQSDLHESHYFYFYNYLLRNLRDIVDLHHIMKERDVSLVIYWLFFTCYTVSQIVIVEKKESQMKMWFLYINEKFNSI